MRNMLLIIANILRSTFRKKGNIIVYLFLPLLGVLLALLIYGNAGVSVLKIGVLNSDNGILSQNLKTTLQEADNFEISDVSSADISAKLLNMEIDAVIKIPEGYTESIYNGKPEKIEVISVKGQEITSWVNQRLNIYTDALYRISVASGGDRAAFDMMYGQYGSSPVKLTDVKLEDKSTGKNMALASVGFLIMFLMFGSSLINMIILKEKRDRTYHRICSAPVSARQFITGNALTSLLVVIIQILVIQVAMKFVFKIDTGISDLSMFIILLMFGLVAIGTGLVVTAFSSSSYMASTLSTLIMTPTCMLGGCFWDISQMPDIMQKIGYFIPQRWAMNAISKLQAGGAPSDIYMNLLILGAFAAALLLIAVYKFARTSNLQKFV
jgi:ABC-2 type transport system permease protein